MFKFKAFSFACLAFATVWSVPDSAEAGPLLDWFLGRRCCRRPVCQQPVVAQSPCTTCQTTCMQTCQRTVVNYVPCTAYRTSWECVPVTTYRAQSNTDPCTGCTVTCMRPCTTYTYRAKQVPYTTYRPVYSTQTYRVPIIYTSQMPAVQMPAIQAPVGGCNTCGVASVQPIIQQPATTAPAITGSLNTGGAYSTVPATGTQVPADTQPQLQQRPIIIEQQPTPAVGTSSSRLNAPTANQTQQQVWPSNSNVNPIELQQGNSGKDSYEPPQLFDADAKTASASQSPIYRRFDYSPVRTASYSQASQQSTNVYIGSIQQEPPAPVTVQGNAPRKINQGWRSLAK